MMNEGWLPIMWNTGTESRSFTIHATGISAVLTGMVRPGVPATDLCPPRRGRISWPCTRHVARKHRSLFIDERGEIVFKKKKSVSVGDGLVSDDGLIFGVLSLDGNKGTVFVQAKDKEISGVLNIPDSFEYEGVSFRVVLVRDGAFAECDKLTDVAIPNGVTEIGDGAFVFCCRLKSITIPDSVTKIGEGAFKSCYHLTSVTLPVSLTFIEDIAFKDCGSLKDISVSPDNPSYSSLDGVLFNKDKTKLIRYPSGKEGKAYTVPDSVTEIAEGAFEDCNDLVSITIPNSITKIDAWAFSSCDNLTSITIPNGITEIVDNTFCCCHSLTTVTIPASVTEIGNWAFRDCHTLKYISVSPDNPNYSSLDGVLFNKDKTKLILYPDGKEEDVYSVPESVTKIGIWAFGECEKLVTIKLPAGLTSIEGCTFGSCVNLKTITIPDGVTEVGDSAYIFCNGLTTVTIPASVTKIGKGAFDHCDSLKSISVSPDNPSYSSVDGVLFNKDKTKLILYPPKKEGNVYSIPISVTEIGEKAFEDCRSLRAITIPDGVTSIGDGAFDNCSALTSITIPDGVAKIGDYTFRCRRLLSIVIPASVTKIEGKAFNHCDSLKSISVSPDNPCYSSLNGVLFNKDKTRLIQYPAGKEENAYSVPESVTEIGEGAFGSCKRLTAITIHDGVTEIGDWAFTKCKGLKNITIPDNVVFIGDGLFYICESLESVTVSGPVMEIGCYVFAHCSKLKSVYYKSGIGECMDNIYIGTPEDLISYYPKGDISWEKAIKNGRWQGRRAEPWEPDSGE